jgi:transglutaminase superfamily protein
MNIGIKEVLHELTITAERGGTNSAVQTLAIKLTKQEPNRHDKIRAIVDELHRRFVNSHSPIEMGVTGIPMGEGHAVDADEACLFVAALAQSVGIQCRFVAARFNRSWTCFIEYERENGQWEMIDPLREWKVSTEPDERIVMVAS